MLSITMKAHVRKSRKPVLILGMDSDRAVTIDEDGNLFGFWLDELKATALEASLRFELDTMGVNGLLEAVSSGDGDVGFEIAK